MKHSLLLTTFIIITIILSYKCDMLSDMDSVLNNLDSSYNSLNYSIDENVKRLDNILPQIRNFKLPSAFTENNIDYEEKLDEIDEIESSIKKINSILSKHTSKINEFDIKLDESYENKNDRNNLETEANQTINELTNFTNNFIQSIGTKELEFRPFFNLYKLKDDLDNRIYYYLQSRPTKIGIDSKKYIQLSSGRLLALLDI